MLGGISYDRGGGRIGGPATQAVRLRPLDRPAFTLAEALMASVVLAIVAASCTLPLTAAAKQLADAEQLRYATELGQALIDEIAARPVTDARVADKVPGPSALETSRKAYLNTDAFNGFAESSDKVARDYEGTAIAGDTISGYWRTASVQYVSFAGQMTGDDNAFALVTVRVYFNTQQVATLTRLLSVEQ